MKQYVQLVMSLFPTEEKCPPMAKGEEENESGGPKGTNLEEGRKA